jgi:hydrogenase maturation protease
MTRRLLIAGVGNIFLGDDGFGVEVVRRLTDADLPDWAHVVDYGIRGMHLAYDLANGYEAMILIDATARGGAPGTIYVLEPDLVAGPEAGTAADPARYPLFNAHGMQPDVVFSMLGMLDAGAREVLVVGCEPGTVDYGIGLSAPVQQAVDEAVRIVLDLVANAAASGEGHHLITKVKEGSYVPRNSG